MQMKMKNGKMYAVDVRKEEEIIEFNIYETTAFELVMRSKQDNPTPAESLVDRLQKKNKEGGYVVPQEEWLPRMRSFVLKKLKPISTTPTGEEFEKSMEAIFLAVFQPLIDKLDETDKKQLKLPK